MRTEYATGETITLSYSTKTDFTDRDNIYVEITINNAKNYILSSLTVGGKFYLTAGYKHERIEATLTYENGTTKSFSRESTSIFGGSASTYTKSITLNVRDSSDLKCKSLKIWLRAKECTAIGVNSLSVSRVTAYGYPYKNVYCNVNVDDKLIDEGA